MMAFHRPSFSPSFERFGAYFLYQFDKGLGGGPGLNA
jgi:hypothetical protein